VEDAVCSLCGKEKTGLVEPFKVRTQDGKTMVNTIELLFLMIQIAHQDWEFRIIENERRLVQKGDWSRKEAKFTERFNICDLCWKYATQTLPKTLVKKFPMRRNW